MNNKRFLRTQALLGEDGLKRLEESTVMVVGLGAVGGYAVEGLARSGVGHLILVDFDVVEETNINRQILALSSTLGMKKTEAAKRRVLDINPDCLVETIDCFVNNENIPEILARKPDYVVDAIDALNPKCNLIEALSLNGVNFISSMGAALRTDPSFVKLGKLSNTKNCGLARFIRKRLKKRGIDTTKINCVYSDEQNKLPDSAVFMDDDKDNPVQSEGRQGRARNTLGSLPTVTAIFGLTLANKIIADISAGIDRKTAC